MSKAASELNEVKSIIRGLLISSTTATSIRQLESDYRNQEGCIIPFKALGYPSTEAFLRSIPDTVNLRIPSPCCLSSMVIVEPVQSKKSNHVEKMVVRQKTNCRTLRGMKRTSAVPEHLSQKKSSNSHGLNGMAPRFIPMALRTSLSRVCQRYAQNGLPLSSLGSEVSRDLSMAGWAQGGKSGWLMAFGFSNLDEVINAFIDHGLIKISMRNGNRWVTSSVEHELVKHKTSERVNHFSLDDFESSKGNTVQVENFPVALKPCSRPEGQDGQEFNSYDEWFEDDLNADVNISDKMKENFRTILGKHPDGLWCAALPYEYKLLTGTELDVRHLGFVSVVQLASQLKDVFICSRPDCNSDWLLFDSKSNSVWNSPAAPTCRERKMASLPSYILRNIQSLLEEFPNGIVKFKFLETYKEKYNEDFPMVDFGFENIMALLAYLASRNVVHLKFSGTVPVICSPINSVMAENLFQGLKKENDFIRALCPLEVMGPNDEILMQTFPKSLFPGCSIDILVTEVVTPSLFWLQLWGTEVQAEFETLMDNIQTFYNPGGPSDHKMPDATIQIGQFCAARYPPEPYACGEWHRARITSLPSLTEVEVFYVDYGSKSRVLRTEIRFLDFRFSRTPMQAHKAALTNVRPLGYGMWKKLRPSVTSEELMKIKPSWPANTCSKFLDLVANQPTVALVTHIRHLDKCLSVGLIDTSKDQDKHINDILVLENLAEFGEMTDDEEDLTVNDIFIPQDSQTFNYKENESSHQEVSEKPVSRLTPPGMVSPDLNQDVSLSPNFSLTSSSASVPVLTPIENGLAKKDTHELTVEQYLEELAQKEAEKRQQEEIRLKGILEQKRIEELKKLEEKVKQEVHWQWELQKLQLYQQQLQEMQQQQYQQYQTQMLLLAAQNYMTSNVPPGLSPLPGSQIVHSAPPPGLSDLLPLANTPANVAQLLAQALQNSNVPTALTGLLPAYGNFPLGNLGYPQWYGATTDFGKTSLSGSGDGISSSPNLYYPPGFENNTNPNIIQLPTGSNHGASSSSSANEHLCSVAALETKDQILNESKSSAINNVSKGHGQTPNTISSEKDSLKKKGTILSENIVAALKSAVDLEIGDSSKTNPEIFEAVNDLDSSLEACSISSCGGYNSSTPIKDDSGQKKSRSKDTSDARESKEKWSIKMEDTETDKPEIARGNLNGTAVNIIKVGVCYYVLTEEILAIFFNNLPVHVALRIAKLRPNGSKIDYITINPRRNRDICKKIESLGVVEVNPHGSDIHLTSVESLHFLCSALGNPV